jgi:hypothetical protein
MTATTATTNDIAAILSRLEEDAAALPSDEVYERKLHDLRQKRETLSARILTIRSATATMADVDQEIAATTKWFDQLTAWRKTLCDEMHSLPIRNDRDRGKMRNLELSLQTIDSGLPGDTGWELETLRLGELLREAGYQEAPRIENQVYGRLPWFGSLPTVKDRLRQLSRRRDDARMRLDDALREA